MLSLITMISSREKHEFKEVIKIDELPFDFTRRRLTVAAEVDGRQLMVTKGAVEEMSEIITHVELDGEVVEITPN